MGNWSLHAREFQKTSNSCKSSAAACSFFAATAFFVAPASLVLEGQELTVLCRLLIV
jgi:Fe-S-cluster containining protein